MLGMWLNHSWNVKWHMWLRDHAPKYNPARQKNCYSLSAQPLQEFFGCRVLFSVIKMDWAINLIKSVSRCIAMDWGTIWEPQKNLLKLPWFGIRYYPPRTSLCRFTSERCALGGQIWKVFLVWLERTTKWVTQRTTNQNHCKNNKHNKNQKKGKEACSGDGSSGKLFSCGWSLWLGGWW